MRRVSDSNLEDSLLQTKFREALLPLISRFGSLSREGLSQLQKEDYLLADHTNRSGTILELKYSDYSKAVCNRFYWQRCTYGFRCKHARTFVTALLSDLSHGGDTLNRASCNVVTSLEDVIFVAGVAVPLLQFVDNRVQNTGLASKSVLTAESGVRNKTPHSDSEESGTSVNATTPPRQRTLLLVENR